MFERLVIRFRTLGVERSVASSLSLLLTDRADERPVIRESISRESTTRRKEGR
jgi:hypothetical protein